MVADGYKDTEIGVIPIEWEIKSLGSIVKDMKSGLSRKLSFEDIGIPVIRSNNITDSGMNANDIKYWYNDDPQGADTKNYHLKDGDILVNFINSMSQIGKVSKYINILNRDVIFTTNLLKLTTTQNVDFILNNFRTERYKLFIASITKPAVNQASFTTKDFSLFKIALPPLKEQEKIADILSTTDDKIDAIATQIKKAETLKKGLLQKLLSEGIGHSEFKNSELGKIPESWEAVKIGNICDCIVPGRNKPVDFNGNIPWITTPDLDSKYISETKNNLYISKDEAKKIGSKIVPINSIIMSCVGNLGILAIAKNEMIINQQLHAFLPSELVNMEFLHYALLTQQKYMNRIATKTAVPYMNKDNCNSIPVPLPPLEEQKQIADILSTADEKLEVLRAKKEKYETLKKGLLQKLLSGEVRV